VVVVVGVVVEGEVYAMISVDGVGRIGAKEEEESVE
jgi:hypothetical protein